MITKVKCRNGRTVQAGTVVRIPFGSGDTERTVYATFVGVHGNTRIRKVGMALTRCSGAARSARAVDIVNILDGDEVTIGRSTMIYPSGVPFVEASEDEQCYYRNMVASELKRRGMK